MEEGVSTEAKLVNLTVFRWTSGAALRVGIVGEYFTIMDPFSNLDLEQKLADMGVEVHRWMNITNRNLHYKGQKNLGVQIAEYCQYEMGPTSTAISGVRRIMRSMALMVSFM